jgi:hypothetical protein
MPDWQGRCDRCGAFIRVDRKHPLGRFDDGYGCLCGCCAVIEGAAWPAQRRLRRRERILRCALEMMLAGRDSVPISITDHAGDREAAQQPHEAGVQP